MQRKEATTILQFNTQNQLKTNYIRYTDKKFLSLIRRICYQKQSEYAYSDKIHKFSKFKDIVTLCALIFHTLKYAYLLGYFFHMVHETVDQDIKRILIDRDITTLKQAFCRIMCAEIRNSADFEHLALNDNNRQLMYRYDRRLTSMQKMWGSF